MHLADIHLEFLGQSGWWITIGIAAGVALVILGWLARRPLAGDAGGQGGTHVGIHAQLIQGPQLLGRPLSMVARVVGGLIIVGTAAIALLNSTTGRGSSGRA